MSKKTQLITITTQGAVEGLDFKKQGLDLKQFGKAKIERTSEIEWQEAEQKWAIKFLHGTDAGKLATYRHAYDFAVNVTDGLNILGWPDGDDDAVILFDEYDAAVAGEVLLIQSARKAGLGERIAPAEPALTK